MRHSAPASLWAAISSGEKLSTSFLCGPDASVALADLIGGSALAGHGERLRGRSVLVATRDQLTAALALIELDGVARRLVLCPSDLSAIHIPFVMDSADVDAIVCDQSLAGSDPASIACSVTVSSNVLPAASCDRHASHATEWILLTSGTTGRPKLVAHTLASLAGAIDCTIRSPDAVVWSTFYDIRRYGGLQIFLRAVLTGASLVLSSAQEPVAGFLARAGAHGVTHISGTPSHWRRALMSPSASFISPQYVRLSGEIADQAILSQLQATYPLAKVAHAFASTEAGVAFDVNDGLAGFPARFIGKTGDVELKVQDDSLRIRSLRTAMRYIGSNNLKDNDGFVDTSDMVELRDGRYYFVGRRDGIINVGGLKVHPEEVEAVINRHPRVQMSLVRTRRNPITGALVVADVVLGKTSHDASEPDSQLQDEILQLCRDMLPRHKVPAVINIVPVLSVDTTGKLGRCHA
jgi:acyl-coenzyme A synthetase/AMP-(fatty) acid ligase